jgi:hypothetical protein
MSFKGRALAINEARAREDRPMGGSAPPRSSAGPRFSTPRPSTTNSYARRPDQSAIAALSEEVPARRRNRNFGPDAKPKRGKREDRWAKAEGGKKGPIPIRGGGRLYGGLEDEPYENFDEGEELDLPYEPGDQDQD